MKNVKKLKDLILKGGFPILIIIFLGYVHPKCCWPTKTAKMAKNSI